MFFKVLFKKNIIFLQKALKLYFIFNCIFLIIKKKSIVNLVTYEKFNIN